MTETATNWLRLADGRVRLLVIRPFSFVFREQGSGQIQQRKFTTGEYLLDPGVPENTQLLAHPWINDFADGAIESPAQTLARLEADEVKQAEGRERQEALLRETQMLTRRSIAALGAQGRAQNQAGDDLYDELNRPLNELIRPDVAAELDTPLDRLARG